MAMTRLTWPGAILAALLPVLAFAQQHGQDHASAPYSGFEKRQIKSLSKQDIEQIRDGGGWGLALPAELNGLPGPDHLLELRTELELSDDQVAAISKIHADMRRDAIAAGERFLAAEAALSDAFSGSDLSDSALRDLLKNAADARAALRYIHLSRHLLTPKLLSAVQIQRYAILRGYADESDPCANVPEGHDATMWRRHNGCD